MSLSYNDPFLPDEDDSSDGFIAISQLQQAIREQRFEALPALQQQLTTTSHHTLGHEKFWKRLWEPHPTSGWTFWHHAAVNVPERWWTWLLSIPNLESFQEDELSAPSESTKNGSYTVVTLSSYRSHHRFITRRTHLGQSVLDCCMASYLGLLPWQKQSPIPQEAIDQALHSIIELTNLRSVFLYYTEGINGTARNVEEVCFVPSSQRNLLQFLLRLHSISQNVLLLSQEHDQFGRSREIPTNHNPQNPFEQIVTVLALNGDCPSSSLVHLLLALAGRVEVNESKIYSSAANDTPHSSTAVKYASRQTTPLHLWAAAAHYHANNNHKNKISTLLVPLLQVYSPYQVSHEGHYPLQLALQSYQFWSDLQILVRAAPEVLSWWHIVLSATSPPTARHVQYRAHQATTGSMGLVVPCREEDYHQAEHELSLDHLTIIYSLLLRYPAGLRAPK